MKPANVIYGLSCICHQADGVRYVGLTSRGMELRLRHHKNTARTAQKTYAVYNWMRKHGIENIVATVLEECASADALPQAEIRWIAELGTFGTEMGLNLTAGGEGQTGRKADDALRARLSAAHLGQEMSAEARLKIGNANLGEKNDLAKLSTADVAAIKRCLHLGMGGTVIARVFGVTPATIAGINVGKTWTHVPGPMGPHARPRSFWPSNPRERRMGIDAFLRGGARLREELNSGH